MATSLEDSRNCILAHACWTSDPRAKSGFLGVLRPFVGLDARNFWNVMNALFKLAPRLKCGLDRECDVIVATWDMCASARALGIDLEGPLRRNHLISHSDVALLDAWVSTIERTAILLATDHSPSESLAPVCAYIRGGLPVTNIDAILPAIVEALTLNDEYKRQDAAETLRSLGRFARPCLGELDRAMGSERNVDVRRAMEEASRRIAADVQE